jgi:membrane-associated phospholipid phosphatase
MQQPTAQSTQQPAVLRAVAKLVSYLFHPLFLPTYIFFWVLLRLPFEFAGITPLTLFARKITVFWMTAFFPAFSVFLLWRLKFIANIFLKTQKERIAPYIITMIFYWWMWYLSRNFTDQPIVLKFFFFGIFTSTIFALIINSFFKISMHAMGIGGALAFVIITGFYYGVYLGTDITIMVLLAGLVCTARLLLGHHNNLQIYAGLILGILCQLIGYWAGT